MTKPEKLIVPKEIGEWLDENLERDGLDQGMLLAVLDNLLSSWNNFKFDGDTNVFIGMNAKKLIEVIIGSREYEVEEPKVYARVKGWELMLEPELTYFNKAVYGSDKLRLASKYLTEITEAQWNELGVNDSNADFEEVQG